MSKHIFWIASYPKSGNTLMRSILISLFFTQDGIFNLKMLQKIPQFESANFVYKNNKLFGEDFTKIHNIEIFYRYILRMQEKKFLDFDQDFKFFKTHSGNFRLGIHNFTEEKNIRLSSWEKHIISWTSAKWKIPIIIITYEDLVYKKEKVIKKLIEFFTSNYGFNFSNLNEKIPKIINTTSFENLKKDEQNNGFIEAVKGKNFFSVGKQNQWKSKLNEEQIRKIEHKFKKIMNSFNYQISS